MKGSSGWLLLLAAALLSIASTTHAFTGPSSRCVLPSPTKSSVSVGATTTIPPPVVLHADDDEATTVEAAPENLPSPPPRPHSMMIMLLEQPAIKFGALTATVWNGMATVAAAADSPDWGLLEGRTGSLLHPVTMISLFLLAWSTALLGFQWRRLRTMGEEISALKKTLPNIGTTGEYGTFQQAYDNDKGDDPAYRAQLQTALAIEAKVSELQAERKELTQKAPRDQHYAQGAILAFLGTAFAIEGPLNTYARAGKLFPGPHLYAGAGVVVLWALAVAMVPLMQKGSDTARTIHITANVSGLCLFTWQVITGVPILLKVVELTKWP